MPDVVSAVVLPRDTDCVAILVNPKAGPTAAQPWVDRLAGLLRKEGFTTEVFTDLALVAERANRWHSEARLRALVGAGGDGTAAELVNRTTDGVPLALLPAGNSNLLARYFQLDKSPELLCRTIAGGLVARIDAGWANGRVFLLMAGCGFDAEVVRRVHARRTGHIGPSNYFRPIVESMATYRFPEIHAEWLDTTGQAIDSQQSATLGLPPAYAAKWLFAFNLPCYGGRLRIAPHADATDGLLDVCGLQRGGIGSGLAYAAAIVLGQHRRLADWTTYRVGGLRLTSDASVPYQLDGDPGGWLPLEIRALPGRLALLAPSDAVAATNP